MPRSDADGEEDGDTAAEGGGGEDVDAAASQLDGLQVCFYITCT